MAIRFENWDDKTIANIEIAMEETTRVVEDAFKESFSTWETHRPVISVQRSPMRRIVTVTDDIYFYVNFGTSVRHALMSNPFVAKTSPGVLTAGAGVGKMVRVSKSINLPGIKARRFDMLIADIALHDLTIRISKAAL